MYLDPAAKGKGAGSAIFRKALEWLGDDKISLDVVEYNDTAIAFYEHFGFADDRASSPYMVGDTPMPLRIMVRPALDK